MRPDPMGLHRDDFRDLFDRERDRTYRFLVRLTRVREDAEELLQDAFVAVWRKRDSFEGRGSAAGYLRRTALRLFLNRYRRTERRRRLAPPPPREGFVPPVASEVADAEARAFLMGRVREALDALPAAHREAFVLFRMQGLSVREIADATGSPSKTVETRIRRATLSLAEALSRFRHLETG